MKLAVDATINGTLYPAGSEVSGWKIYPFFLLHVGIFGASSIALAYFDDSGSIGLLVGHAALAIPVYLVFYLLIFGLDEVKWMLINGFLGLVGIYAVIDWLLGFAGKTAGEFAWYLHVVPATYYVLYTFLLRQMVLDATGSRDDPQRRQRAENLYIWVSAIFYLAIWLLQR